MTGEDARDAADAHEEAADRDVSQALTPTKVVTLRPVDASTRSAVLALTVRSEQASFVAAPATYLHMCDTDDIWHPLAVLEGDRVVGFLMWAVDEDEDSCWLGGFIIDAPHQGRGLGRAAVLAALDRLSDLDPKAGFALSYEAENTAAAQLYSSLGFVPTGEMVDDEVVARRAP